MGDYPLSRLLAPTRLRFVLLVLLFLVLLLLVTRIRAYEADVRCLLRRADQLVKNLVGYTLLRLLLAARHAVVVALRVTGGVNGR
jgi:hypothetical protein